MIRLWRVAKRRYPPFSGEGGLYVAGRKIDKEAQKREQQAGRGLDLAVAPSIGPSGGGLVVVGRF